jgi:hypothetical protein
VHLVSTDGQGHRSAISADEPDGEAIATGRNFEVRFRRRGKCPAATVAAMVPSLTAAVEAALRAGSAVAPGLRRSYVVQKKDNLWKIATGARH